MIRLLLRAGAENIQICDVPKVKVLKEQFPELVQGVQGEEVEIRFRSWGMEKKAYSRG